MPVTEETFRQLALQDPEGHWELHGGCLREKPGMTADHNDVMNLLTAQFWRQLDSRDYRVRTNSGHVWRSPEHYYIPDVSIVPTELIRKQRGNGSLETFEEPLPLVVEVWSPSTGEYDVDAKLPEYQRRGDREIWRIHPLERTLIAWRRQADGTYLELRFAGGTVQPVALPWVSVDLDRLFD